MDNVLETVLKLIAEPFREKERTVWISPYDMARLKVEMAHKMGIRANTFENDASLIKSINNVQVMESEWVQPGKIYLLGADDNPLPLPVETNPVWITMASVVEILGRSEEWIQTRMLETQEGIGPINPVWFFVNGVDFLFLGSLIIFRQSSVLRLKSELARLTGRGEITF